MVEKVDVRTVQALEDLERAIQSTQNTASDVISLVRSEISSTLEWIVAREEQARHKVSYCESYLEDMYYALRDCYSSKDDDYTPNCSGYEDAVDDAKKMLHDAQDYHFDVMSSTDRIRRAIDCFASQVQNFQGMTTDGMERSRLFLQAKITELNHYLSIYVPDHETPLHHGVSGSSTSSSTPSPPGNKKTGSRFQERGIVSVPLGAIRLEGDQAIRRAGDFYKVPFATMLDGVRRFSSEVLPEVEKGAGKDYFRQKDSESGVEYQYGLLRLYEAFYGDEPVRLTKMRDGRYEVTNGRHRLFAARAAGLESIPASVVEEVGES